MKHVVAYDISQDRIRNKVANILKSYGLKRIQYSIFGGSLSQNRVEMLDIELKRYVKAGHGDVRIFYLCPHRKSNILIVRQRNNSVGDKMEHDNVVVL